MATRAEFLAGLRLRLDDGASKRWQDTELIAYLTDAARDYSKYFPRLREQEFTADGVLQRYDVPTDLIDDQIQAVFVTDPTSARTSQIPERLIKNHNSNEYYQVIGEELVFAFTPGSAKTILIRYNATHTMPDTGSSSIPYEDEDLVYAYAMAAAWQRIGGNDAGLSRWTEGQKRDDSPLIPHYVRLWSRYERLVTQKLGTPRFYKRVRATGSWR